jgi:hypothetical protein
MFSGVLVLAGATLYITDWIHVPYVFAVGTAGITVSFMTISYKNLGFRRRRLHRINVMAGASMIAASVFMFHERMEWVVFLFIAALLLIYTSFVNPRADE